MWELTFYEVAAQLLPVFFLTLVIEYRLLRREGEPERNTRELVVTVASDP